MGDAADPFASLAALEDHVWAVLAAGARREGPARFVALATASGRAGPQVRMVALRGADRGAGTLEMASDVRTAKVRALKDDPRAEVMVWDDVAQVQIRVALDVEQVRADPDRWARLPDPGRLNYGTDPAPGVPVERPADVSREGRIDRFVALVGRVRRIDVVSLAHEPHRRARLAPGGATWTAP